MLYCTVLCCTDLCSSWLCSRPAPYSARCLRRTATRNQKALMTTSSTPKMQIPSAMLRPIRAQHRQPTNHSSPAPQRLQVGGAHPLPGLEAGRQLRRGVLAGVEAAAARGAGGGGGGGFLVEQQPPRHPLARQDVQRGVILLLEYAEAVAIPADSRYSRYS